jgi:hypothetical protein
VDAGASLSWQTLLFAMVIGLACGHFTRDDPTLLLHGYGNILYFRSVTGRTIEWAQAHFFVAAGWTELQTGLGRGVFR